VPGRIADPVPGTVSSRTLRQQRSGRQLRTSRDYDPVPRKIAPRFPGALRVDALRPGSRFAKSGMTGCNVATGREAQRGRAMSLAKQFDGGCGAGTSGLGPERTFNQGRPQILALKPDAELSRDASWIVFDDAV